MVMRNAALVLHYFFSRGILNFSVCLNWMLKTESKKPKIHVDCSTCVIYLGYSLGDEGFPNHFASLAFVSDSFLNILAKSVDIFP